MIKEHGVHPLLEIASWDDIRTFIDTHAKVKIPDDEVREGVETFRHLNQYQIASLLRDQDKYCTRCGECCRECNPIDVTKQELKRIADHLGASYKALKKRLTLTHKATGLYGMKGKPCPFFQEPDTCKIYDVRPLTCKIYPMGKPALETKTGGVVHFPDDCPAVKEMLLYVLLFHIIVRMMKRKGILPKEPSPELIGFFKEKTGFTPDSDPILQVLKEAF